MTVKRRVERWKVRKEPTFTTWPWQVFDQDGDLQGSCSTFEHALEWATSIARRVEYWLEHQR